MLRDGQIGDFVEAARAALAGRTASRTVEAADRDDEDERAVSDVDAYDAAEVFS